MFLLKTKNSNKKPNNKFVLVFVIVIVITAAALQFTQWKRSPISLSLLTQEKTLLRLTDVLQINSYTSTQVNVPKNLFNARLEIIGVYPQENASFPKNTVALVYVRDGFRFVEVSYRPDTTLERERIKYGVAQAQEITLSKNIHGTLLNLRSKSYCKKPNDNVIGICQITKVLLFEKDGIVIVISVDGTHASEGELIEITRSITNE